MNYFDHFIFGIYPYIALSVFLLGSLIRFDRDQYTWKSDSSQLLRGGQLHELGALDGQARALEDRENVADVAVLDTVGLDDGESLFDRHDRNP